MAKWEEGQRKSVLKKSSKFIDMTGFISGMLIVSRLNGSSFERGSLWECKCICGGIVTLSTNQLRSGHKSYSCGCRDKPKEKRSIKTHGKSGTSEFGIWKAMRSRCQNVNHVAYMHYGGRGITVCPRWEKFNNFWEDMGPRPSSKHSIERVENSGNYEPSNCVWGTRAVQNCNKRSNRFLHIGGLKITVAQASLIYNVPWHRIRHRAANGWPARGAIFAPVNTKNFKAYE